MSSGAGAIKRRRADSIRAAKLAAQGWTHRNIAEAIGCKPAAVKARIILGERLLQAKVPHD